MTAPNRIRVATLGQKVRSYRTLLGLSQDDLARRATVAQAVISRIERDETDDPGIHQVALIAAVLGRPLDQLLSDEGIYGPRIAEAKRNAANPLASPMVVADANVVISLMEKLAEASSRQTHGATVEGRLEAVAARTDLLTSMFLEFLQAAAAAAEQTVAEASSESQPQGAGKVRRKR